jgi:hypothetical protein
MQSILLQNALAITKSLLSSSSTTQQDQRTLNFLNRITSNTVVEDEEQQLEQQQQQQHSITQKEFEDLKRELTILLDLAVQSKMKIEKAFPQKLAKFGKTRQDFDKYGLNWHPGWREPQRFVPEVDCDPYRGACMISSCPCDAFETWPLDDIDYGATNDPDLIRTYVYNPRLTNPETDLCYVCHHLKSDHQLWSPTLEIARGKLTEFNRANVDRYSFQYVEGIPTKHPMNVPLYILQRFYDDHPETPGANVQSSKLRLADIEEEERPSSMSAMVMSDDLFDDDELF